MKKLLVTDQTLLQVVLQNEVQENPDIAAISINVKEIIEMLAQEEEVQTAWQMIFQKRIPHND